MIYSDSQSICQRGSHHRRTVSVQGSLGFDYLYEMVVPTNAIVGNRDVCHSRFHAELQD